jgi:hypothetical protein
MNKMRECSPGNRGYPIRPCVQESSSSCGREMHNRPTALVIGEQRQDSGRRRRGSRVTEGASGELRTSPLTCEWCSFASRASRASEERLSSEHANARGEWMWKERGRGGWRNISSPEVTPKGGRRPIGLVQGVSLRRDDDGPSVPLPPSQLCSAHVRNDMARSCPKADDLIP